MVKVIVPATTANFGPGFDCMGAALNLYNVIEMDFSSSCHVNISGEGEGQLPFDESNLVYKAARRVLTEAGIDKPLSIKCENHIPLSRGLGSSAACIAGGMMAANRLIRDKLSLETIIKLATEMEGHPDNVMPALVGGFTISMMSEKCIVYKKYMLPKEIQFVVGIPHYQLKTEDARKVVPQKVDIKDAVYNIGCAALMASSLATGDLEGIGLFFRDRLHQPYRSKLVPGLNDIIEGALGKGALGCFLSGAGPSVICLSNREKADEIGAFMLEVFRKHGIQAEYQILTACEDGVKFI